MAKYKFEWWHALLGLFGIFILKNQTQPQGIFDVFINFFGTQNNNIFDASGIILIGFVIVFVMLTMGGGKKR